MRTFTLHFIFSTVSLQKRAPAEGFWKAGLDLLAYCRVLVDPHHDPAFLRILNVPRRGLGKVPAGFIPDLIQSRRDRSLEGMYDVF